jgi:hypothetical protein
MLVDSVAGSHASLSEEEKAAIREQLERLLVNPYFSHSRRFPSFLRFVVEHTLEGRPDVLKERTLGIEIFGKSADYDTASDPIVRVTAAEIRKRIAQYYQDPGHEHELRISLPSGSYVPQFHTPASIPVHIKDEELAHASTVLTDAVVIEHPAAAEQVHSPRRFRLLLVAACIIALLSAGATIFWRSTHLSGFDFFWGPVLNTSDPVLFCIADQNQYSAIALRDADDPAHQIVLKDNLTAVVIDDLTPIVKIAGVLQSNGKKYSLRGEGTTSLMDLRSGPTIFIGAFDNAWTLRLTKPLRYHFANNAEMTEFRIVDSNAPSGIPWGVDRSQQMTTNNYRDYAIVARFTDSNTGKVAVIAAGVGRGGTVASGEFLTDPNDLAQLERAARAAGNKKNMEIVLSTQIIDGQPGTPKLEASYFW